MTLQNGNQASGVGMYVFFGVTLTVSNVVIQGYVHAGWRPLRLNARSGTVLRKLHKNDWHLQHLQRCRNRFWGGGLIVQTSSPTFINVTVRQNSVAQFGGGVYAFGDSAPLFINCVFENNTSGANGGEQEARWPICY